MPVLLATALLSASCTKSKKEDKGEPQPIAGQLAVTFDNNTIPFHLIDSGYVALRKEGSQIATIKHFIRENNKLQIAIDDITPGNYTASLYIDAHLEDNNKVIYREYRIDKQIKAGNDGILISGPTTAIKKDWKPHVVFTNTEKGFYTYVPLNCEDPAFEVLIANRKWDYFYIERAAHQRTGSTNKQLSSFSYNCSEDCVGPSGYLFDKNIFRNWSTELANYSWNNGVIIFIIMDQQTGEEHQYSHIFERPDSQ